VVESAVVRALFPEDEQRRAFLRAVGASTALAAISQFFPLGTAIEAFAQAAAPEKRDLKVGFIPITCATPIIMAHPMGFYTKHGLNVEVVKTAGWAVIRDKTGTYADGLGSVRTDARRIDFDPFPWESFAIWILTQMKRWGQIKGDVNYANVARQVYLATDTARLMKEVGLTPPTTTSKTFAVMGKMFDPAKPEDYVKSFSIRRAA